MFKILIVTYLKNTKKQTNKREYCVQTSKWKNQTFRIVVVNDNENDCPEFSDDEDDMIHPCFAALGCAHRYIYEFRKLLKLQNSNNNFKRKNSQNLKQITQFSASVDDLKVCLFFCFCFLF